MSFEMQEPIGSGFTAKSTADEVLSGIDLAGKTAVVTGGYSGIGIETSKALVKAGADVIVPVKDPVKARKILEAEGLDVKTPRLDLGDLATVKQCADEISEHAQKVDILINNAAIMACPETRLGNGWEAQFTINHIGHFVFTNELLPLISKAEAARIICLSSLAHRLSPIRFGDFHFSKEPYHKWAAYGQSKTANALHALELNKRYKDRGVKAFSVHPGGIMTPLQRHLPQEEMVTLGWMEENGDLSSFAKWFFKTPEQGASTSVWCATNPKLETHGGEYCEDCDIAQAADEDSPRFLHVQPYACDEGEAERLWVETEKMLA